MRSIRVVSALLLSGGLLAGSAIAGLAQAADEEVIAPKAIGWTELQDAPWASVKKGMFNGAATAPDGSVVVAGNAVERVLMWHSTDAAQWDKVGRPPDMPFPHIVLLETPWGLELVSPLPLERAILRYSTQDGLDWGEPSKTENMSLIGTDVSDAGVWVAGSRGKLNKPTPALWHSSHGEPYELVPIKGVRKNAHAWDVAPLPGGGFLLVTSDAVGQKKRLHIGTADGTWKAVPFPAPGKPKPTTQVSLASAPEGVAMAVATPKETTVWITTDGVEWDQVAASKSASTLVQSAGSLYLAPAMLASSDGRTWCSLGNPFDQGHLVQAVTELPDGRLLVAGFSHRLNRKRNNSILRPVVWVSDGTCLNEPEPSTEAASDSGAPSPSATEQPLLTE